MLNATYKSEGRFGVPLVVVSSLFQQQKSETVPREEHMRRPIFLAALVALVISGAIAQAADVSGTWNGEMQQKQDSGDMAHAALVFVLKQTDGQITGKAGPEGSGQPISDAKLEGDRLTFSVPPPAGEKGPTWKFDLKVSGTRMEGRAQGTNGDHSLGSTDVVMNRSN